jgi:hypothetical protein
MQRKPPGANEKAAKPTTGGYHGVLRAGLAESEACKKMLPEMEPGSGGESFRDSGARGFWSLFPGI